MRPCALTAAARMRTGLAPPWPTLFDRFARRANSAGLGLGLYLTRGIAEAQGGTLTVESTPGQGTTFRLALPAH